MLPQIGREVEQYADHSCEFGLGWTRIQGARNRIHAELRVFVPVTTHVRCGPSPSPTFPRRTAPSALHPRELGLETHPAYYFDPRVVSEGAI